MKFLYPVPSNSIVTQTFAEHVHRRGFQRGIPPPVHHEVRVPPDQPRGQDPQGKLPRAGIGSGGVLHGAGLGFGPQIGDHRRLLLWLTGTGRVPTGMRDFSTFVM